MQQTVKVTADLMGNVVGRSQNNPEYGYIRVTQMAMGWNERGWLVKQSRSALLKGKYHDLVELNYRDGDEIEGKIIVREQMVPFYEGGINKDLKIAGKTGVVCRVDEEPIYRQSFFTKDVNAEDELIQHTNTQEIKDALSANDALSEVFKHVMPKM